MGRTLLFVWLLFAVAYGGLFFLYARSLPIRDENAESPLIHAEPGGNLLAIQERQRSAARMQPQPPSTQANDPRKEIAAEMPSRGPGEEGKPRQRSRHDSSRSAKAPSKTPRSGSGGEPLFAGILRRAFGG